MEAPMQNCQTPLPTPFELTTGASEAGWCDFSVRLGDGRWNCQASYIGDHPLKGLIHSALGIHAELSRPNTKPSTWDRLAAVEGGGIVIRAHVECGKVRVKVFHYPGGEPWPSPEKQPQLPEGEAVISFQDYALAIYRDSGRAIMRQGIVGVAMGWEWSDGWPSSEPIPIAQLLRLSAIVHNFPADRPMALDEEIEILRALGRDV